MLGVVYIVHIAVETSYESQTVNVYSSYRKQLQSFGFVCIVNSIVVVSVDKSLIYLVLLYLPSFPQHSLKILLFPNAVTDFNQILDEEPLIPACYC